MGPVWSASPKDPLLLFSLLSLAAVIITLVCLSFYHDTSLSVITGICMFL